MLFAGSDEELNRYIDESGKCLVVDWRGNECDLIDDVAALLPGARLTQDWDEAEGDWRSPRKVDSV